MQKRFTQEELTLEKLQEVRLKYDDLCKNKNTETYLLSQEEVHFSLEEEDLLMLGEDGIKTLSIPETEEEIDILNTEISEQFDLMEEEFSNMGIYPKKVKLLNDSDGSVEELKVMDFSEVEPGKLQEVMNIIKISSVGTSTGHVDIGSYPTSNHYYDGLKCAHSQLGYLQYTNGVSYIPVMKSASSPDDKAYVVARVYSGEYFTYLSSSSSNSKTQIKIKDSGGTFTTGYIENRFNIQQGISQSGYFTKGTPAARARLWIEKAYGWVQKIGGKKQPLFKNFYSTNGGIPIYDGDKNQIGKRAGYGCYVSGRIGAKTGESMKNWLQIQYYQTSTSQYPQGDNTFYSAGTNHPYFVSTGIDSNSTKPFIRVMA
ncbi:hypothetical protein [Terrisporobacter vanillatitrophus]|uniref:hypothetical protein n=1 Tax=Terrisporobacter vanillatitrophus TaxID=3058402 RepID=UPI0033667D18